MGVSRMIEAVTYWVDRTYGYKVASSCCDRPIEMREGRGYCSGCGTSIAFVPETTGGETKTVFYIRR